MRTLSSVQNLGRALYLIARQAVPLAVVVLIGLVALHLLYLRNPARTDMQKMSMEYSIVSEQILRASTTPTAEIAFFGDSTCLMGVDPLTLQRSLGLTPIQSFCTIGYVGPAGHAALLDRMIERGTAPKTVVLMFHPWTFRREPSWESWPAFVGRTVDPPPALNFPRSALDFVQLDWISRALYRPLPAAFGKYYGSETAFRRSIRQGNGAAIDPSTGLRETAFNQVTLNYVTSTQPVDFTTNQAFDDAVAVLAKTIKSLPQQTRVYLIISPLPENYFRSTSHAERTAKAKQLAAALGIDEHNILNTPATMNFAYFADLHLNRWGRQPFSEDLSKALAEKFQE